MRRRTALGVGLVALVLLVGWPLGAGHSASPQPAPIVEAGLSTDAVPVPAHAATTPLGPGVPLGITLTLPWSDGGRLSAYLAEVQDPRSPNYLHFLTSEEFRAVYDPSPSVVRAVVQTLAIHGGTDLRVSPDGATVSARLPASQVEALFGVELRTFGERSGLPLYTSVGTPTLPNNLAGDVVGIGGLTDALNPELTLAASSAPQSVRHPSASQFIGTNGTDQWLIGSDLTQAYGASELFPGGSVGAGATYPTGEAIATLLFSAWNQSQSQNLPPWDPNVVYTYFNNTTAPGWPATHVVGVPVPLLGVTPPLPQFYGALNDTTGAEFENSLDLEMAGDLAPGSTVYNFYFAGSILETAAVSDLADDFAIDLSSALNYNYSGLRLGVVSGSFGLPDLNDSAWNVALQEAAATGVTVAIASGDQGNAPDSYTGRDDGQWLTWPGSAAFNTSGALSVGGVSLRLSGTPTAIYNGSSLNVTYDAAAGGIAGMTAWWSNDGPVGTWSGSEGGLSEVLPEPAWEFHSAAQPAVSNASGAQGATQLGRAGPDLAFPANDTLAYVESDAQGNLYFAILEGTSIATPMFAGLLADEIADTGHSFGFLDPQLYRMGSYFAAHPGPTDPFYDVTTGNNYVFAAGPGWDATTGWGGVAGPLFLAALSNTTVDNFVYTGPTPGLVTNPPAPAPAFPWTAVLLIVGLAVAAVVALVIAFGRPRRESPLAPPSWGSPPTYAVPPTGYASPPLGGPPVGPPSAATFLCPYCGAPRPAEPVRCPRCGAL